MTIGDLIRDQAASRADAPALVAYNADRTRGRTWSYKELASDAERLGRALAARYSKGERIVVWSTNRPEWVILQYAAAFAGLVLVTANPTFRTSELRYVLEQSGACGVFISQMNGQTAAEPIAAEATQGLSAVREVMRLDDLAIWAGDADLPDVSPYDPAQIQFTSGTTGFPKGAKLSHHGLLTNARFTADLTGLTPDSTYLNVMPLFHTAGCALIGLGCLQAGCRMILAAQFEPNAMGQMIETEAVTVTTGVPTMILALLETHSAAPFDTSSLQRVICGGSMVAPALVTRTKDQLGAAIAVVYGQTEASPLITMQSPADTMDDVASSVGQALPHTEVSIRHASDNTVAGIDEVGEICARGPCTMLEYHNNPDATAATVDADGWLHTGDLGRMDARGYVAVTGRLKEMIIRGGENLFPAEIENVLINHPGVAEVSIVGLPDDRWGELVAAFIRPEAGHALSSADLKTYCREHLSSQKTPSVWRCLDSFPMTASGKIQKFKLVEDAADYGDLPA